MQTIEGIIATCLEKWVKRLQLSEWEIFVSIVDKKAMKAACGGDVMGCCLYEIYTKKATIHLRDILSEIDIEKTLLHELLHLCLADDNKLWVRISAYVGDDAVQELINSLKTDCAERLIHIITSALLKERC